MTQFSRASAADASKSRAKLTNDPLRASRHGRGAAGRRIRDLFRSYVAQLGNATDHGTQAGVLAAAELVVAAEVARSDLLAGRGDVDQVVRLENLSARALRRLGLGKPVAPKRLSYVERMEAAEAAQRAAEGRAEADRSGDTETAADHDQRMDGTVPQAGEAV